MSSSILLKCKSIDDFGGCTISGNGLVQGFVGQPTTFFVHTATLDMLYLDFIIEGPTNGKQPPTFLNAEIYCIEPNLHGFVYVPSSPGKYNVSVKWNGRDVYGSPFKVNICTKEIKHREQLDEENAKEQKSQEAQNK